MAQINLEVGDTFIFHGGVGIYLGEKKYFTISGEGGRTGYQKQVTTSPPTDLTLGKVPNFEVQFAIECVATVLKTLG